MDASAEAAMTARRRACGDGTDRAFPGEAKDEAKDASFHNALHRHRRTEAVIHSCTSIDPALATTNAGASSDERPLARNARHDAAVDLA